MDKPSRKWRLSFSLRTLLELVAVVAFVLALFIGGAWIGAGRYEMHVDPGAGRTHDQIYVIDKQTGHVWRRGTEATSTWRNLGSPTDATR